MISIDVKGATKSYRKITFVSATKIGKKHNKHFKLLFFKLNSHIDSSN